MRQNINLYLAQYPPPKKISIPFKYIFLTIIIVSTSGVAGGLSYVEMTAKKAELAIEKNLLNIANSKIRKLKKLKNSTLKDQDKLQLIALQGEVNQKKGIANTVEQQINFSSQGFSRRYVALSRQDVRGLWLKSIDFDSTDGSVTLKGATVSAALLTEYLRQLAEEPSFNGVSFSVLKIEEFSGENLTSRKFLDFIVSTHALKPDVESIAAMLNK